RDPAAQDIGGVLPCDRHVIARGYPTCPDRTSGRPGRHPLLTRLKRPAAGLLGVAQPWPANGPLLRRLACGRLPHDQYIGRDKKPATRFPVLASANPPTPPLVCI